MKKFEKYHDAVRFLESLEKPFGGAADPELYLARTRYLLGVVGNPERGLHIIHITGTAGKGSVAHLVHAMLVGSGWKTGLFTSPFVTALIEEIQVGDLYISPAEFVSLVEEIKPYLIKAAAGPYGTPSYFEIVFVLALLYFKRKKCEWAVLEVGLGGRYDATNAIAETRAAAITNIEYDHTHILGKTLQKIAWDKAGIIKRGCAFFTTERRAFLLRMFKKICTEKDAEFRHIPARAEGFQKNNITLARAIARRVGIGERVIKKAIHDFKLPCRFEIIRAHPFRVILDGAHNVRKIRSVLENLKKLKYQKLFLVFALADDKDTKGITKILAPIADKVFVTRFTAGARKCKKPEEIVRAFGKKVLVQSIVDPLRAFRAACACAKKNDIVLVTGSFYLAGKIRTQFYPEERILRYRKSFGG